MSRLRVICTAMLLAATFLVAASSASAELVHPFLFSFDGSSTPAGAFTANAVAVDNSASVSAGDVYVSDLFNRAIDKFSISPSTSTASYICQITGAGSASTSPSECDTTSPGVPGAAISFPLGQDAVDSAGDLYHPDPATGSVVDEFSPSGSYLSQIVLPSGGQPVAVAIAPSGDVLIADATNKVVEEYSPATSSLSTFATGSPSGSFAAVSGVAVDDDPSSPAYGDVYVADQGKAVVDVFDASGAFKSQLTGTPSGAFSAPGQLAVDPATGDLYVSDGANVDEFDSSGAYVSQIQASSVSSIAIQAATGDLYVAGVSSTVAVYGPAVALPDVTVGAATNVQQTSATLAGHVDPAGGGNVTSCEVEYGTSTAYGQTAPCAPPPPYAAPADVSADLTGLAPSTTYHFRLDAGNANGTNDSEDGTFRTAGPPAVDAESAANITRTTSTLQAQLNPGGLDTTYHIEYGPRDCATNPCISVPVPDVDIGVGMSDIAVSQSITGLSVGTTYHYRVVATNSAGTTDGTDQTFTTLPVAAIDLQSALPETTRASLRADINPLGLDTSCEVEWVADANYQTSGYAGAPTAACTPADLGSASSDQGATVTVSGLQQDTVYHYRFVVTNRAGIATGSDETFTTFGPKSFSFGLVDQNGHAFTQAGGHPWALTTGILLNTTPVGDQGVLSPAGDLKDVEETLPAGLIGNPTAVPQCTDYDLGRNQCPLDSQVGLLDVILAKGGPAAAPLFNMVPPPGVPAEFGAWVDEQVEGLIVASVRTGGDYGINAASLNLSPVVTLTGVYVEMWGVPADPSHDNQRCLAPDGGASGPSSVVCGGPAGALNGPNASTAAPKPFLTNPTSCNGSQTATVRVDSYHDPGDFATASATLPPNTGCDRLDFTPSITVQPDTSAADSPTGLSVDLHVPQNNNPAGLAEANLKDATVTLPAGVSVNPSAANGLTACTPAEIGIDNASDPACPDAAKIGTVEVDTPLLPDPLTGSVYVAEQSNNPFNSLLAIYVTAQADGVLVKLAGHVIADPVTGQLRTTFSNNPQLPFTDFKLDFFGGPQAVLATPQQLGTYTTTSDLSSWAGGPDAAPSDSFQITSGAVSGFEPSFSAGTQNAQAGAYSPFVLSFSRSDTDQNFQGLTVKLPPGMLAKLAGVKECTDGELAQAAANTGAQEQANPSCPSGSQVGTVVTTAGAGPDPMPIAGKAYLTGPYKRAPYGIAVVVPAVAGPYDLGTVVVRQALEINPTTAQVTDVSDPFPTILQGIPLRIRSVSVDLDRPDFTVNPTSCDAMSLTGTLTSTGSLTYTGDTHFQVGGCQDIGFSPKLKIGLSGKGQTKSGDHPTLTATLTDRTGQANLHSARVTLPLSMALDPNNSQHVCAYATAAAVHGGAVACPTKTIVGKATADTPLLSKPLTGNVYLVQGLRCAKGSISAQGTCANGKTAIHTLPSLLVPLRGQIALDLRAKSSVNGAGALVTTFSTIPDAPVSKFTLQITGGKKGLLVVTGRGLNICAKKQVASENLGAQSGKNMVANATLTTPCAKSKAKAKKKTTRGRNTKKQ